MLTDPDTVGHGQNLAYKVQRRYSALTRHPNPTVILLGPPGLVAAGQLGTLITEAGAISATATSIALAALALSALQYELRQRRHIPLAIVWRIHRKNLKRGKGNLHTLHHILQTACEAEEALADPGTPRREKRAAEVAIKSALRIRRIFDVEHAVKELCPPNSFEENACCPSHATLPTPLTLADARKALAIREDARSALRTLLAHSPPEEHADERTCAELVRTLDRETQHQSATGVFTETVETLAPSWTGTARELAEFAAIVTYGSAAADSQDATAAR